MINSVNPPRWVSAGRRLLGAVLAMFLAVAAWAEPAHVLIRVPAGRATPAELPPLLAQWRQSGRVADVLLLTQGRAEKPGETPGFEALVVLEFTSEAACAVWQQESAPVLPAGLITARVDRLTHGEVTPRDSSRAVFVVNAYTPTVVKERYDEFVQGYIAPLYAAQRATKRLTRSSMYLERGAVGQAGAFAVLEYRDLAAFEANTAAKLEIRQQLTATVPSYAKFHEIKDGLRKDGGGTFATYTELPPPRS